MAGIYRLVREFVDVNYAGFTALPDASKQQFNPLQIDRPFIEWQKGLDTCRSTLPCDLSSNAVTGRRMVLNALSSCLSASIDR